MQTTNTADSKTNIFETELFQTLIENISEGVVLITPEAEQVYQSPSVERMTGFTLNEYKGIPVFDFIHPHDRDDAIAVFGKCMQNPGMRVKREYRLLHKGGYYIWIEGTAIQRQINGQPMLIANYRDITEEKNHKLLLAVSDKKYRHLFENNPLPMWVIDAETFRFLDVNEAAVKHYGYSRLEFLCMTAKDIRPAEDISKLAGTTGVSQAAPESIGIWRHIKKEGSLIYVNVRASEISYEEKKARLILAEDVTARFEAEEALKVSENRFHSYLDNMLEGVQIIDFNWRYTYVNDVLARQTKITKEQMLGRTITEIYPGFEHTALYKILERCFNERVPIRTESEFTYPDGSTRWFKLSFEPVPEGVFILSIDITERKQNEASLQQTYKAIANYKYALDESAIITITDKNGCIIDANENFLKISKYTIPEILGKNPNIFNSGYHPRSFFNKLWETVLAGKIWKGEMQNKAKDGSLYWVDTTIVPFLDSEQKIEQFMVIRYDITERKKAEQRVLESEADLNAVIENTEASIYSLDCNYRYITFNSVLQQSLFDVYGLQVKQGDKVFGFLEKLHPGEAAEWKLLYDRALNGEKLKFVKQFNVNNKPVYISFSITPIYESGRVRGLSCYATDITHEKLAELQIIQLNESLEQKVKERTAELQDTNRELEAFSYTVSHDLQAPLRTICGFSQILRKEFSAKLGAEGERLLAVVDSSAVHMSDLIHDLLEFAKLGKTPMAKKEVDMDSIVKTTINEVRLSNGQLKAQLKLSELGTAVCDAVTIRQVWLNLIANAVKYSSKKEQPHIEIGVKNEDGRKVYYVKDNGVGFDMQYAGNLFGAFKRLHCSSEFEGTGVGLATVSRIVERHGGKIWAEAKVNEGAAFYFTLAA